VRPCGSIPVAAISFTATSLPAYMPLPSKEQAGVGSARDVRRIGQAEGKSRDRVHASFI
jgi:hypothetical protein